ncbi:MAG: energy-coupling factor transporter transmembrane component T [Firmicutes bacterium]|nr:energy-coupling factor transporter transmembrane component T [Bacillota bacterium]
MLKDMTMGQYFPTGSVIHRLDARVKLICTIAFIVAIFMTDNFIMLGFCAVATGVMIAVSKVHIKLYLKMLKSIWPVIVLTSILNIFYVKGDTLVSFWIINITVQGVLKSVFIALRIMLLILVSSMLTYCTSPTELTDGIERLLSPLRHIGLGEAVHTLAMMTSIAMRFIPTLVDETEKIMNAQKARGADFDSGNLIGRVKAMLPIMIPLLMSAVRRAIDLAQAMECRCYNGGAGRTKMKQLHIGTRDVAALIIVAAIVAVVVMGRIWL